MTKTEKFSKFLPKKTSLQIISYLKNYVYVIMTYVKKILKTIKIY